MTISDNEARSRAESRYDEMRVWLKKRMEDAIEAAQTEDSTPGFADGTYLLISSSLFHMTRYI